MRSVSRVEQLVRSFVLLVSCALFSVIAWLAGAYDFADQTWTYACVVVIVAAAALVSRLGTRWLVRRFAGRFGIPKA